MARRRCCLRPVIRLAALGTFSRGEKGFGRLDFLFIIHPSYFILLSHLPGFDHLFDHFGKPG